MRNDPVISQRTIDWAAASRALPGQAVCGDLHLVKPIADGLSTRIVLQIHVKADAYFVRHPLPRAAIGG